MLHTHFRLKDTCRLKVKGLKNHYHGTGSEKKAGIAMYVSNKIDIKTKSVARDKNDT